MARLDLGGVVFALLALLTLGSAVVVARARDVVHAVVALLGTLVGVAGLYLLLAADFLAAMQLMVYAGGTLVLFLFAAMLTARAQPVPSSSAPPPRRLARYATFLLVAGFSAVAIDTVWPTPDAASVPSSAKLGHALLGAYLLPFELASMVLLATAIGAFTLVRRATDARGSTEGAPAAGGARE